MCEKFRHFNVIHKHFSIAYKLLTKKGYQHVPVPNANLGPRYGQIEIEN